VAVAGLLAYEIVDELERAEAFALVEARTRAERDLAWISSFTGSIYVSDADTTSRGVVHQGIYADSIVTPEGLRFYQLTPPSMVLRLQALSGTLAGARARLVSRTPLNPANMPDSWEKAALENLGPGEKHVVELASAETGTEVRMMIPLQLTGACLRCHAAPPVKSGPPTAGVSLALPPGGYYSAILDHLLHQIVGYAVLWLVGLTGLFVAGWRLETGIKERDGALEQQLRQETLFREVWNQTFEGMRLIDRNGIILSVNEAYCRLVGKSREELEGKHASVIYGPEDADRISAELAERMKSGGPPRGDLLDVHMWDGRLLYLERYDVLMNASDEAPRLLSVFRDLTEQRKSAEALEQSEAQLRRAEEELRLDGLRMRIAADLHDDIGSTVSSTTIFSSILRQKLSVDARVPLQFLNRIEDNLRTIQDSLRDIVWSVNPENDALENVLLRIQEHAAEVMEVKGITLSLRRPEILREVHVPMQIRRPIVLILKEAVNNVVKHAACTNAWLSFDLEDGILRVALRDNGKGFVVAKAKGYGLSTMSGRAQSIGGSLVIDTAPGRGTEIRFSFPIA
jgi:PAS domain S-box-containing protein